MDTRSAITGVILAGGAGRRVGHRDKGLLSFRGKPLVAHVCENLSPQVGGIVISCNRNLDQYRSFAPTVVIDRRDNFQGPLSGLESVANRIHTDYVAIAGCDMPCLPPDWVERLAAAMNKPASAPPQICYAHDGNRAQYLCALISRECLDSLEGFLDEGRRAVKEWYGLHGGLAIDFSDDAGCFVNYNEAD